MIDCDLSPDEISRIVGFMGYGPPSANVWFIGMEEGLGRMSAADMCVNLKARAKFEETMDLREAHLRLLEEGIPIDIEKKTSFTQVWQYMAKIMCAYQHGGHDHYIRRHLGREDGTTFLTELSSIPSGKASEKREWIKFFDNRDPDLGAKLKERDEKLRKQIEHENPPLVICYGFSRKTDFALLLGGIEWQFICEKVYASHDRKRLLVPFLGQGQMSHEVIERMLQHGLLKRVKS